MEGFHQRILRGNWDADHTDYVEVLATVLKEINARAAELFVKTEHPGFHMPVVNTVGEYTRAHKELYKLVGADNLQEVGLKKPLWRRAPRSRSLYTMAAGRRASGRFSSCSRAGPDSTGLRSTSWPRTALPIRTRWNRHPQPASTTLLPK